MKIAGIYLKNVFLLIGMGIFFIAYYTIYRLIYFIKNIYLFSAADKRDDDNEDIDIVFLWVDGEDPEHNRKKRIYLSDEKGITASGAFEEKAIKEYRWINTDELLTALKSIEKFCSWVRRIWIVTDNQTPVLSGFSAEFTGRITIVDHRDIFRGYEEYLPTFNSRSIESMIWRIDDLSEKFIYFNDDMFVIQPLSKNDFFISGKPVIRGYLKKPFYMELNLHQDGIYNGAKKAGFRKNLFFKQAHVPYPLLKSEMKELFYKHKEDFEKNISHRFRSRQQFLAVSLFYHTCIMKGNCVIYHRSDYLHLSEKICSGYSRRRLIGKLKKTQKRGYRFICINDLFSLKKKVPDFLKYLPEELSDNPG